MANNNQIELVVTVEVDKANQSIKSVNANLSGIEAAATKSADANFAALQDSLMVENSSFGLSI